MSTNLQAIKPGYPASALLNVLLQHYATDFPKYTRNVNISDELWKHWNNIYEDILTHIDKVEAAEADPEWDAFDKYTNAIGPLETILLELETHLSINEVSPIPEPNGVSPLITFMLQWLENRQKFINAGEPLEKEHFTGLTDAQRAVQTDLRRALKVDDETVLGQLANLIAQHGLQDDAILERGPNDKFVSTVRDHVQTAQTDAQNFEADDFDRMGKVVFAIMAIYIPFLAHDDDKDNAHVISTKLWKAVQVFAEFLVEFVKNKAVTIDTFNEKWAVYEKVLLDEVDAFALQMVTLMRLASKVRRPFFGRTVGVIKMWQALTSSKELQAEKAATRRATLSQLLVDTMAEFEKTGKEVTAFSKVDTLEATIAERKEGYTNLVGRIKSEVDTYSDLGGKWEKLETAYGNGVAVDDENLKKFLQFIQTNESAALLTSPV
ncbi:hypothetical protein D9611_006193 [Ephemerocybe angulata]|uniref:Uncharacterized protein n=1 Tax=Ephemerocybe angulata TaxID=980116 RepID=A0A8H5C8V0_9AGAR|nr:hypothetical protein D9611_006193 [Tulosesus angulatus]